MRAYAIRHLNLYVLLRITCTEVERQFAACTETLRLSPAEVIIFLLIAGSPIPTAQSDLAPLLKMTPKAMSKLLSRLVRRRLLLRRPDVDDGRRWVLLPTAKGRQQLKRILQSVRAAESPLFSALGPRRWRELVYGLKALGAVLDGENS